MKKNKKKSPLFPELKRKEEAWREEWKGMPEYDHQDLTSFQSFTIHFRNQEDVDEFSKLIGQRITPKQQAIWFPALKIRRYAHKRYSDES
jgi:hypothetical protein